MAKIKKNSILQGIRGSLGDVIIRHMRDGSIRANVKPVGKRYKFNQEQKGYQDRMRLAVAYAKEARTDLFYEGLALETNRDAYHVALSDGLKSPVIHAIERRDGRVRVTASDNLMVTRVRVSILDGDGNALEEGDAALPDPVREPERWEYAARAEGTVEVTVWDLAYNRTMDTLSLRARATSEALARRPGRAISG
jgi:hypothetical protein